MKRPREPEPVGTVLQALEVAQKDLIVRNVVEASRQLGLGQHHHSAGFVASMYRGIRTSTIQELSGFGKTTINDAFRLYLDPYGSPLFTEKAQQQVPRPRGEKDHQDALRWLRVKCAASKSNDQSEVFRSTVPLNTQWLRYRADGGAAGVVLFQRAWKDLHVQIEKHPEIDRFSCLRCNGTWSCFLLVC